MATYLFSLVAFLLEFMKNLPGILRLQENHLDIIILKINRDENLITNQRRIIFNLNIGINICGIGNSAL